MAVNGRDQGMPSNILKSGWLPRLFTIPLPRIKSFSEMGVSGTPVYAGYVLSPERSSKLIGQERYRTFADILANTSIVSAGVRYFLNIIAKPSWSCEAVDQSDEAKKACEFVETVLDDLHTPWSRVVRRTGTYRFHGFAIQEWTANRRDDGTIGFHDIESRPQWTIWRWEVDERGTVTGAWQRDPLTGRELGLPRGKIMYIVDDTLTDSPEGMGLLRHCVEPAERLKDYLSQEAVGLERDLRGIPIARAPLDELSQAVQSGQISQAQMDQAIANMQNFIELEKKGRKTSMVVNSQPFINRTDSGDTMASQYKWGVELIQGAAPGLSDVANAVIRLNTEMARILGVEHLMLGSDSTGSFALAKEKANNLYLLANSVLRDIRLQTQHDLIWPLWSLNGFDEKLMPELKTEDVQPRDVEQVARVLRDMATAGSTLPPDDEVQNFVRDLLGAPHMDLDALALQAQQMQDIQTQQFQQQQETPAQQGLQEDKQDQVDASGGGGQVDAQGNVRKAQVGDRVKVKPGSAHDEETSGKTGTVVQVGGKALGVKFDGMKDPHKWYTDNEVDVVAKQVDYNDLAAREARENLASGGPPKRGGPKQVKEAKLKRNDLTKDNPNHDPDTGQFSSGEGGGKKEYYSYPKSHSGISIGDEVTVGSGKTAYKVDRIQVRNHDQQVKVDLSSGKSRQYYSVDKLRPVKKVVPYTESEVYQNEDDNFVPGRAGAANGPSNAEGYFSERGNLSHAAGPSDMGQGRAERDDWEAKEGRRLSALNERDDLNWGNDVRPGSRLKTKGRPRVV